MFSMLTKIAIVAVLASSAVIVTVDADEIAHDTVPVWAEPAPSGVEQKLAVKLKPQIQHENSCNAYPAVDKNGNTNGGLKPSGSSSAGCKDRSEQQIYAHTSRYNNQFAMMYRWYMSKDSQSTGLGQRHEWESLVVWLSNSDEQTATVAAMAAPAHGGYKKTKITPGNIRGRRESQGRYFANWPNTHELAATDAARNATIFAGSSTIELLTFDASSN